MVALGFGIGVLLGPVVSRYIDNILMRAVISGILLIALLMVYRRIRQARAAR